jgi:glycosyltransferase involved in cell wall biosynthesis
MVCRTPEASVVIPTYNRRDYVLDAIKSVLAQRDAEFELIVVDDGSGDGTLEALEMLLHRMARTGGSPPIILIAAENRGPAAARNLGARFARSTLLAFLDSDDVWASDKLRAQIDFMNRHPECAIVQTGEIWFREGRRVNPGERHRKYAGDIFIDSVRTCLISPSAVMMRSRIFSESGGFDEDFRAAEDYDLWLRILIRAEVGLIDQPLVTRRAGHPDQLSATVRAIDRFRILALLKLLALPNLSSTRRDAIREALVEKCRIYSKGLRRRKFDAAAAWFENLPTLSDLENTCTSAALQSAIATTGSIIRRQGLSLREAA